MPNFKYIALLILLLGTAAEAASNDIKCRVRQIQQLTGAVCVEKYTFPALCLTLECLSKAKFECRGNGKNFKVKFFYRYRQAKDQFNQYSVKPEFQLKRVKFTPAEEEIALEPCP